MNVLILKSNKTDFERFYIDHMQSECVDTYSIYKPTTGFWWYLTVACIQKIGMVGSFFFNSVWEKKLNQYDTVIVFDRNLNWNIFKHIKKHNSDIRCIAWYWNPIRNTRRQIIPERYRDLCEVWSFDPIDCKKYGLQKNNQFYFPELKMDNRTKEYAAFFVGYDKGRYSIVDEVATKLNMFGWKTFVGVISDKKSDPSRQYIKEMPYEGILELINKSECIIDIPQQNQEGITLRVLESLFWNKKLITTNQKIKEYDFYNETNILVWDSPSRDEIDDFFNSPLVHIDETIISKYSFRGWLDNFGIIT